MRRSHLTACLIAGLASGCLGDPESRSCADLPPDAPGCGAPDAAPGADVGPDEGPDPDSAPPDGDAGADASPDGAVDAELEPPDMAGDAGPMPDGAPDAMWQCQPGTDEVCGIDEGACRTGRRYCNAQGVFEDCLGAVDPTAEVCDGVDNDCNGETDEGCDCVDGTTQPCGSDVGACMPGEQRCADGAWGACEGAVDGVAETCDGVDSDCDGEVDNVPAVVEGLMCTVGTGECRASGPFSCEGSNDGQPLCTAVPGLPAAEACNTLDDDCDGTTDEDIDPNRGLLYGRGGTADAHRPAVAAYGEFHGVAWLEDGRVFFGLALGEEWEIAPAEVGNFNGDDLIAERIALAGIPGEGFRLAVSYDGLGAGVTVLQLDGGGREVGSQNLVDDSSLAVDIAWQSRFGYAMAAVDRDVADGTADIDVHVVPDDAMQRPVVYTAASGQLVLRRPSVALVDGTVALAAIRSDQRVVDGEVVFFRWDEAGTPARSLVISDRGTAQNPDLIYAPTLRKYVLTWDEVDVNARGLRKVRVAILSLLGQVEDVFTMPTVTDAEKPSVMSIPTREGEQRIAVTWSRPSAQGFQIELGWVVQTARGWMVSPVATRIFGEQGSTDGGTAAYASDGEGIGAVFTYDDTRSRQIVLATLPRACPQQP